MRIQLDVIPELSSRFWMLTRSPSSFEATKMALKPTSIRFPAVVLVYSPVQLLMMMVWEIAVRMMTVTYHCCEHVVTVREFLGIVVLKTPS